MSDQLASPASRSPFVKILFAIFMIAIATFIVWKQLTPKPITKDVIQDTPTEEPEDFTPKNPGYMGIDSCTPCHTKRVQEFSQTRHFFACCTPDQVKMPEGFEYGKNMHPLRNSSLTLSMVRENNHYLMQTIRDSVKLPDAKTEIAYIYGAQGKADEMYFGWRGKNLFEFPMAWLHPKNVWGNSSVDQYAQGFLGREVQPRCLECHSTWFAHIPGTSSEYSKEGNVITTTCEKCHGPGRDHIAFHKANPTVKDANSIVHPSHLNRERQMEVCTQCHSNSIKRRTPAFSYRPGEELEKHFSIVNSRVPEEDHVANQNKYIRESKCFQKSDSMTCVTCHNPHKPEEAGAVSCQKCHQPEHCKDRDKLPAAVRQDCIGCHMPKRIWMNVHFHTQKDEFLPPIRRYQHRISVDPIARQEVLLKWHKTQSEKTNSDEAARLTKTLTEYWLTEADSRTKNYRFLAAIGAYREAYDLDPSPRIQEKLKIAIDVLKKYNSLLNEAQFLEQNSKYAQAKEVHEKIIAMKPDNALSHGKIGLITAMTGKLEDSKKHLEAVAKNDPTESYGFSMLGWLNYLDGKYAESVEYYRKANEIEPFYEKNRYHMGLAYLKLNKASEATSCFNEVIRINPNSFNGHRGLGESLRISGKFDEAIKHALYAVKLGESQKIEAFVTLMEAYEAKGDVHSAVQTGEKALDVAYRIDPKLVSELKIRIEKLESRKVK